MLSLRRCFCVRLPSTFTVFRLPGKLVAFSSFLKKKPIDLRLIAAVTFLFDSAFSDADLGTFLSAICLACRTGLIGRLYREHTCHLSICSKMFIQGVMLAKRLAYLCCLALCNPNVTQEDISILDRC